MPKRHNAAPLSDPVPSKICGGPCGQRLPLTSYHKNCKSPDERLWLCKDCRREKEGRKKQKPKTPWMPPETRILAAVHAGATTLAAIRRRAGVSASQIDGLLADMVLNRRELVTKAVGEVRHYYALPS